jgi:hypothetical protein
MTNALAYYTVVSIKEEKKSFVALPASVAENGTE